MEVKNLNGKIIAKIGTKRVSVDGSRYDSWIESRYERLKQILITYNQDAINSIQMVYEQNGQAQLASRFGGDGDNFYAIGLASNEHFTSVSGHFGMTQTTNYMVIRSLRFRTNLESFGPFGCEEGTPFSFDYTRNASICGFHHCSNNKYLIDFGVYLDITNLSCFQYPPEP